VNNLGKGENYGRILTNRITRVYWKNFISYWKWSRSR